MKRWWLAIILCWMSFQAMAEVRVVYHLSEGIAQASRAMNNIRNHLEADPDVKICMQILHSGPIAYTQDCVGPSPVKSRIGAYTPRELDEDGIEEQIAAFANCAALAKQAGYDGVEIIGSAGYLISTFLVQKTNLRTDRWGGSWENRMRFPVEVVRRVRAAVGPDFILVFRISAMDMLQEGLAWDEVVSLAKALEAEGIDVISTHFCWHESFVPTIATMVPRAAFAGVTGRLKKELSIPLITSNRINMPDVAEAVLARGDADIVSMARPMLADPDLVNKARTGREDQINTCIGCNQACLDHTFTGQLTSCLVNARACREVGLNFPAVASPKRIAVVGAGPAGLAFATLAAKRGHKVTLFDAASEIGGQFNLAKRIPGKEEFYETLRYFAREIEVTGVELKLGTRVDAASLKAAGFDEVVIATGIEPRKPALDGIDQLAQADESTVAVLVQPVVRVKRLAHPFHGIANVFLLGGQRKVHDEGRLRWAGSPCQAIHHRVGCR